ncbi:23823_t:CDS:2, partial [Racocetra persica]
SDIENICGEISYNDPNKDFEILDDVSIKNNSESFKQLTTPLLSSAYNTSNRSDIYNNLYDLYFDKTAIKMAKKYANLISQATQEQIEEESDSHQESELNIELSSSKIKYINQAYIIIDKLDGKLQRCSHNVSKPLRQLGGGAVLPFDCIDQHNNNSAKSLQFIAKWVNDMFKSVERDIQYLLLYEIFKGIMVFFEKLNLIQSKNHEEINDKESDNNMTRDNKNDISKKQS